LCRLSVVFLAFDVFFAVFCVAMACFIGIALCCCLPCVIAILYALAGQEGASDADIGFLPRYRYSDPSEDGQKGTDEGVMIPVLNNSGTSTSERILLHEDAVRTLLFFLQHSAVGPYCFHMKLFIRVLIKMIRDFLALALHSADKFLRDVIGCLNCFAH
jgi:hypothetical protein